MARAFVTPRLAIVALLGAAPAAMLGFVGVPVPAAIGSWAALSALVAAIDFALAPNPEQVAVARRAPARAHGDEPVPVLIDVQNHGGREIRGAVQDTWPRHATVRPSPRHVSKRSAASNWIPFTAAPGESARVAFTVTPKRRRRLRSGYIAVRAGGPLGLAGKEIWHPLPAEISVSNRARRGKAVAASPIQPQLESAADHLRTIDEQNGSTLAHAVEELQYYASLHSAPGHARSADAAHPIIGAMSAQFPRMLGRDAVSDTGSRLTALLAHLSDLLTRAAQVGEQQRRLLVSRYAETLTKLASLLADDYYGDILRNPGYWSDPDRRIEQVRRSIEAVDHEIVENVRQLSESRDIEFQVAIESLTRPQRGARLSDVYGDRSP